MKAWMSSNFGQIPPPTPELSARVPTSSENHGKPGKSQIKIPCMEKSWNLIKAENHGKIMEFCEISCETDS